MKQVILSIALSVLVLTSCQKSELEIAIDDYCKCAKKIELMDDYDYTHYGGDGYSKEADSIYKKVNLLMDSEEHSLKQTKRFAECTGIIATASRKRLKEFDKKHGFD